MSLGRDPRERLQKELREREMKHRKEIEKLTRQVQSMARTPVLVQNPEAEGLNEFRQHEQHYANTILLLGYGGFFALWATTAGHMPRFQFGLSGLLMGASLLFFIGFELAKTYAGSSAIQPGASIQSVNEKIAAITRWWRPVFFTSVFTGLSAGAIVLWCFGEHALSTAWSPSSDQGHAPATASRTQMAVSPPRQVEQVDGKSIQLSPQIKQLEAPPENAPQKAPANGGKKKGT